MNLPEGYKFKKENLQILKIIGHGGQCTVYLAGNKKNEKFAVKQLTISHTDPLIDEHIKMFKREYELLSLLKHPMLPKGYKYFQEEGEHFIVVEYVSGKNVDEIIHMLNRPFDEDTVIEIAFHISELLVYLSSFDKPVVLRDIKPSNMIITPEGKVKFIDFSIAREFNEKDDTVRLGSPGYAPPEQYRGHSDSRSDVYALGVTMYELLTMKDPALNQKEFFTPKTVNTKYRKLNEMVEILTRLKPEERYKPEELNDLLKTLRKEKNKSGLKKLAEYIYNIKLPDMMTSSVPEKSGEKLFLKFNIEETGKGLSSFIEIFFVILFLFITMCLVAAAISPAAGVIYFMLMFFLAPMLIVFAGISTYKYIITDEYIEIKGPLFRKSLFTGTRIYWNEITDFEKKNFEDKKIEYIIKINERKEIIVFPRTYSCEDEQIVRRIISLIKKKSNRKLKEVLK